MKKLVVLISAIIILLSLTGCLENKNTDYYTAEDLGMSDITFSDNNDSSETESSPSVEISSETDSTGTSDIISTSSVISKESVSLSQPDVTYPQNDDKVTYYEVPVLEKPKMLKKPEYKPAEISGEILDQGKCGDTLYWELYSNGTLRIHGSGRMYDYVKYDTERQSPWYKYRDEPFVNDNGTFFKNPDGTEYVSVAGYNKDNPNGWKVKNVRIEPGVTYIGNWAFYRICVEHLEIPEGVTETGYFAIRFSPTLKTVSLPDSLVLLDDMAISRNQVLEYIYFGNSLKTLGLAALNNNDKLKTVILPDSVTEVNIRHHQRYDAHESQSDNVGLLESCDNLETVWLGSVKYVPQRTFLSCSSLEEILIPNTVEYVEEYAFFDCKKLNTVIFEKESRCKLIESKAFFNSTGIEYFIGCTALETIETNAFVHGGMSKMKLFEFSNINKEIQNGMFMNSQLVTANIGTGMNKIPASVLTASKIREIYISKSVNEIASGAFKGCSQLKNIYYDGTRAEWNKVKRTLGWAEGVPEDCVIHFSDKTSEWLKNVLK